MDTPERCSEIAKVLEEHGYTVKPTDEYLTNLATRLRNAGYEVTEPDDDDGAQAAANAGTDQPQASRQAARAPKATQNTPAGKRPEGGAKGDAAKA